MDAQQIKAEAVADARRAGGLSAEDLAIAALVMIFQPFSKWLSGLGMALVVLGGLAFNLVPLCQPGRPAHDLVRAAMIVLLIFAVGVLVDAGRRYVAGSDPIGTTMMVMAVIAAGVNLWCLILLKRVRQPDVNMRAATTFSFNDFISNGGILVGGGLVLWLGQNWPDLVVAVGIAIIAFKGGIEILHDAHHEAKH